MRITVSNCEVINSKDIYIHDRILEDFRFFRNEKILHLEFSEDKQEQPAANRKFSVDFLTVIGFEMTSGDFWGSSPYVLDFEYIDRKSMTLIPKLFDKKHQNNYQFCPLTDQADYFETVITFTSGDQLCIACKEIVL